MNCTPKPERLWPGQCEPARSSPRPSTRRACADERVVADVLPRPFRGWLCLVVVLPLTDLREALRVGAAGEVRGAVTDVVAEELRAPRQVHRPQGAQGWPGVPVRARVVAEVRERTHGCSCSGDGCPGESGWWRRSGRSPAPGRLAPAGSHRADPAATTGQVGHFRLQGRRTPRCSSGTRWGVSGLNRRPTDYESAALTD